MLNVTPRQNVIANSAGKPLYVIVAGTLHNTSGICGKLCGTEIVGEPVAFWQDENAVVHFRTPRLPVEFKSRNALDYAPRAHLF